MTEEGLGVASREAARPQSGTTVAHTPGPWSFEDVCFDRRIPIRGGTTAFGRHYNVALVNRPGSALAGQDKANARLIAAAPELLSQLRAMMGKFTQAALAAGSDIEFVQIATADARAAIAKAEGRS